jgi:hypothetical protein
MTHLTPDELIDAMDGILAPGPRQHLAACRECRRQLDDLSGVLHEAKQASAPEPSPLFWQQLSRRVNASIDTSSTGAWPMWLRWPVLLPLGALAMIVVALTMAVAPQPRVESINAVVPAPAAAEDTWASFADLVGTLDVDVAAEAGVIEPGVADQAVLHLTAEEQQELSRLLQAELTRAKS